MVLANQVYSVPEAVTHFSWYRNVVSINLKSSYQISHEMTNIKNACDFKLRVSLHFPWFSFHFN